MDNETINALLADFLEFVQTEGYSVVNPWPRPVGLTLCWWDDDQGRYRDMSGAEVEERLIAVFHSWRAQKAVS